MTDEERRQKFLNDVCTTYTSGELHQVDKRVKELCDKYFPGYDEVFELTARQYCKALCEAFFCLQDLKICINNYDRAQEEAKKGQNKESTNNIAPTENVTPTNNIDIPLD